MGEPSIRSPRSTTAVDTVSPTGIGTNNKRKREKIDLSWEITLDTTEVWGKEEGDTYSIHSKQIQTSQSPKEPEEKGLAEEE